MKKAIKYLSVLILVLIVIMIMHKKLLSPYIDASKSTEESLITCYPVWTYDIETIVSKIVDYHLYDGCILESLCNEIDACKTTYYPPEEQVATIIQHQLDIHAKINKSNKQFIESGDLLKISYTISDISTGQVLFFAPNETARCGEIIIDPQIYGSLEGRKVGETYIIEDYISPDLSNNQLQCTITPLYIYTLEEAVLTDEFVQQYTSYGTVEEWKNALFDEYAEINRFSAWQDSLSKLISESAFILNQEALLSHATEMASYDQAMAKTYGMDLEQYVQQTYNLTSNEYLLSCYQNCKREIQEYLIVGELAKKLHIHFSASDLNDFIQKKYSINIQNLSEEECYSFQYLYLRSLVMDYFVSPIS